MTTDTETATASAVHCTVCGQAVDPDAIAPGTNPPQCFDCSINRAGEAVDQRSRIADRRSAQAETRRRTERAVSPWIKAVAVIGGIIVVLQIAIIVMLAPSKGPRRAVRSAEPEVAKTAAALGQVMLISEALEQYRREHGTYPPSLEQIAPMLPPEMAPLLGGSGMAYDRDAGRFTLSPEFRPSEAPAPLAFDSATAAVAAGEGE